MAPVCVAIVGHDCFRLGVGVEVIRGDCSDNDLTDWIFRVFLNKLIMAVTKMDGIWSASTGPLSLPTPFDAFISISSCRKSSLSATICTAGLNTRIEQFTGSDEAGEVLGGLRVTALLKLAEERLASFGLILEDGGAFRNRYGYVYTDACNWSIQPHRPVEHLILDKIHDSFKRSHGVYRGGSEFPVVNAALDGWMNCLLRN